MLDIPTQTGFFSLTGQEPHAKLSQNKARSKLAVKVLPVQKRLASIAAVINIAHTNSKKLAMTAIIQ